MTKERNAASDEPEARAVQAEGEIEEVMKEVEASKRRKLVKSPDTPTQAEIDPPLHRWTSNWAAP